MISIIIMGDPLSRESINSFCERSGQLEIKAVFRSATDAMAVLNQEFPELVLMDEEVEGFGSFRLPDHQGKLPSFILITARGGEFLPDFPYPVTEYLKKPVSYPPFQAALQKVKETLNKTQPKLKQEIEIKCNSRLVKLFLDNILYIEGMGDYVKYVTAEKTYITHSTLKNAARVVSKGTFLQVHRSYIVNTEKIEKFSGNVLTLHNITIPVSKSNKADLRERLRAV